MLLRFIDLKLVLLQGFLITWMAKGDSWPLSYFEEVLTRIKNMWSLYLNNSQWFELVQWLKLILLSEHEHFQYVYRHITNNKDLPIAISLMIEKSDKKPTAPPTLMPISETPKGSPDIKQRKDIALLDFWKRKLNTNY